MGLLSQFRAVAAVRGLSKNTVAVYSHWLKSLQRRTRFPFAHYRRRIVVELQPGDIITMRLEGTRTHYTAAIADLYRLLARWHASAAAAEKRRKRKR